jgi:hypothetical protein
MRRNSVATMMAIVLLAGLAMAALRHAWEMWAGAMLLVTLGLLGASILGALNRRGSGGRSGKASRSSASDASR